MSENGRKRGFASLTTERRKEIAALGGKTAHAQGVGRQWTQAEAVAAGRKGGLARAARGTGHKFSSETGRAAGQKARDNKKGASHE